MFTPATLLVMLALAQATAPTPAPAPATAPAETPLEAARRETREMIAKGDAEYEIGEPAAMSDLFRGRIENGFLVVESSVPPDRRRMVRPLLDDPDASAAIVVGRPGPRNAPPGGAARPMTTRPFEAVPVNLTVRRAGGSGPRDVVTYTALFANVDEGQIALSRDSETLAGDSLNVHLNQLRIAPGPDESPVTLGVNYSDAADADGSFRQQFEAQSFVELRRTEPAAFEQYVRPMLAEVGLSAALVGELRAAATQVFLADLPVAAATEERVTRLLPQLDAAAYADRVAAEEEIEAIGRPAATILRRFEYAPPLSPEQASRVAAILDPWRPMSDEQEEARRSDVAFLRDVAALQGGPDDEGLRYFAEQRLKELGADAPTTAPTTAPSE